MNFENLKILNFQHLLTGIHFEEFIKCSIHGKNIFSAYQDFNALRSVFKCFWNLSDTLKSIIVDKIIWEDHHDPSQFTS